MQLTGFGQKAGTADLSRKFDISPQDRFISALALNQPQKRSQQINKVIVFFTLVAKFSRNKANKQTTQFTNVS
jgi:hypothetical protein